MFATEEYNAYVAAQLEADRLFQLELQDPHLWSAAALAAQDLADELYDRYEYAAGLQSLEMD
jgi:hypothetical protein